MVQAWSIGKGKRKDLNDGPMAKLVPGPGTYAQANNTVRAAPSWGFGTGKRPKMATSVGGLGPG